MHGSRSPFQLWEAECRDALRAACPSEQLAAATAAVVHLLPPLVQLHATLQPSDQVPAQRRQAAVALADTLTGLVWQGSTAACCEALQHPQPQPQTSSCLLASQERPLVAQLWELHASGCHTMHTLAAAAHADPTKAAGTTGLWQPRRMRTPPKLLAPLGSGSR